MLQKAIRKSAAIVTGLALFSTSFAGAPSDRLPQYSVADSVQTLTVDLDKKVGKMQPMWAYVGYDEGNYTYLPESKKLMGDLVKLSQSPVYIRAHNLLNTNEGSPMALKWGSTNAYTEDKDGNPVYDWKTVDKIVDTWVNMGIKPLMEIGFMPKALSTKPEPYKHKWSPGDAYSDIWTGWAYPPNNYDKWEALIYEWVKHSVTRYGQKEVESWWWQLWNEPDAGYWAGTDQEYFKLYDYTAKAVKRALPSARVGGPNVTGGLSKRQSQFLTDFLEHCRNGKNNATGKKGTQLDFVGFHAKGSPKVAEAGHVQMGLSTHLKQIDAAFKIIKSFPEFAKLPVIIGESDPEGCAACSSSSGYSNMAYRNGTMFSSYFAASFARKYELADKHNINLEGAVSWTFTFPGQPWFDGFRSFATHGVGKPVLNVMRMFGLMSGDRVAVSRANAYSAEKIMQQGVVGTSDVNAMATRDANSGSVMVWNYNDEDIELSPARIALSLKGIPVSRVLVHQYRIDETHSNSFTAWREMGAPQQVTNEQYRRLEESSQLELISSPQWVDIKDGKSSINFELPAQGVSLFRVTWN
ncbi:GH39 family glycosyl hydrolase [Dyadobacter sp. CY312]|uniref:GH39 family glycosyl hydrolase n=1 Tax=Dyadobacter sp. CY312 TaxID=2907303 RepID=UPI001F17531F|nr:beta-xylosidase [Dyadobacter sp. CY312]MCE7039595.1 beta-xylosidase [Dyadobacter sp. CY312]